MQGPLLGQSKSFVGALVVTVALQPASFVLENTNHSTNQAQPQFWNERMRTGRLWGAQAPVWLIACQLCTKLCARDLNSKFLILDDLQQWRLASVTSDLWQKFVC